MGQGRGWARALWGRGSDQRGEVCRPKLQLGPLGNCTSPLSPQVKWDSRNLQVWGGVREEGTSTGVRLGRREEVEDMLGKERICRLTAAGRKTELRRNWAQCVGKEVHSLGALVGEGRECFVGPEGTRVRE